MQDINWKTIIIELLIVFVGVYGAFMLNGYRQQNQKDKVQLKYYQTFLQNLKRSSIRITRLKQLVDSTAAKVKQSDKSDLPYSRNLDFSNTFLIFESAFAGNNFTSISSNFLLNIEGGSNLIKNIEKRFNILDAEVRKYRIYHSAESPNREKLNKWYMGELNYISESLGVLINTIESENGAIAGSKSMIEKLE